MHVGPHPRRLNGTLGTSHSSAPFRNRSEAFDTAWPSQSFEQAKVPRAVLPESPIEARPERTARRTHPCGRRNEAAQSQLELTEIKSIPYLPLSHPFVERLIGTLRREYLDHLLFWTTSDLEKKLLDFRTYFNNHRTHTARQGRTPETPVSRPIANLRSFGWQPHCRSLFQTPMAA